ncbi:tyrosine-type recombinase/integrase [Candidatus Bipolaricaulota bacterium]
MGKANGTNSQNSAAEFTLSAEEIQQLFDAAPNDRDRAMLRVLYFGGIRRQELCDLDVTDVEAERGRILIRDGKGGKSRAVLLPGTVLSELGRYTGRRRTGPLFLSARGKKRLSVRGVNYVVENAGDLAGLTNPNPRLAHINPHLLRHSFARHYLAKGGDIRKLSEQLGHASIAITHAIYGTASEEEKREEYDRLMQDGG